MKKFLALLTAFLFTVALAATGAAVQVNLAWDAHPNTDGDLAVFTMYYCNAAAVTAGCLSVENGGVANTNNTKQKDVLPITATTANFEDVADTITQSDGDRYTIVATDNVGNSGADAALVSLDLVGPPPPANFRIQSTS